MPSTQSSRVRRYVRQYEDRQARRGRQKIFTPLRILLMLLITAVLAFFGVQVYRAMGPIVGKAFCDGLKLKK